MPSNRTIKLPLSSLLIDDNAKQIKVRVDGVQCQTTRPSTLQNPVSRKALIMAIYAAILRFDVCGTVEWYKLVYRVEMLPLSGTRQDQLHLDTRWLASQI